MRTIVALPLFAALLVTSRANAVATFSGGKSVAVHEDYVIVHHDESTKRVHMLFAARVVPAHPRMVLGIPTPATPTIEVLSGVDLPAAVHQLIAPHETRLKKRPSAPPAPWLSAGTNLTGFVVGAGTTDITFDAAWTKSYVDKGFVIAALDLATPADDRLEVSSPTAHISFVSERLTIARREPPLATVDDTDKEDKPRLPVTVSVGKIEPRTVGISSDALAKVLRNRPGPLLDCYERFLELKPNEVAKVSIETTIRPKGEVAAIKVVEPSTDAATKDLGACTLAVLRKKQMPRADEGYRYAVEVSFTPPRTPSRRTHIVTIGASRQTWRNAPASVRLLEDFEVASEDVARALRAGERRAIGLREGQRVWVSHWLDRDARRTLAEDAEFASQELPKDGESGTLSFDPSAQRAEAEAAAAAPSDRRSPKRSRKTRRVIVPLAGLAIAVAFALWIVRSDFRS